MIKDFNAVTSALNFSICSILKSSWLSENTRDSFGNDEAGVEGFSSGVGVAVICSVAIMGLTLKEFLPLDGLLIMIPFLLREAILSDNVC